MNKNVSHSDLRDLHESMKDVEIPFNGLVEGSLEDIERWKSMSVAEVEQELRTQFEQEVKDFDASGLSGGAMKAMIQGMLDNPDLLRSMAEYYAKKEDAPAPEEAQEEVPGAGTPSNEIENRPEADADNWLGKVKKILQKEATGKNAGHTDFNEMLTTIKAVDESPEHWEDMPLEDFAMKLNNMSLPSLEGMLDQVTGEKREHVLAAIKASHPIEGKVSEVAVIKYGVTIPGVCKNEETEADDEDHALRNVVARISSQPKAPTYKGVKLAKENIGKVIALAREDDGVKISEIDVREESVVKEEVRAKYVANCVKVLNAPGGTVQAKLAFCKKKGATDTEWMEALNQATDGEVVKAALGTDEAKDKVVREGTEVEVDDLPDCDFCGKVAAYDGKTTRGPWANMCKSCFKQHGVGVGTGKGQKLIKRQEG